MTSRSIEAGKAFVRVDAELSPLQKKLKQIDANFKALGSKISGIGSRFAVIGAGATAIGSAALGGITALATRFAGLGDELSKTRDRTGIAASSLSELGYAATQSGTDLATVEKSVAKMQRGIVEANAGSETLADAFRSIGLSIAKLAKLSPEDQFLAVGQAIARIPNATTRAAKAMQIFGKSGTQLLPLLISDIDALRQEARDLGVVISDQDATNATNLGDAFDRVKKSLGGIATQLGAAVAVPFTNIANTIASIVGKISQWVAANRAVVQSIAAVAAGLVAIGTVASGVGVAIVGIGATISSIGTIVGAAFAATTAAFGAIAATVGAILSPIGLVTAAVVGLGAFVVYSALESTNAMQSLGRMFGELGATVSSAWSGIVSAIGSGDMQQAGQIAFTALGVAWQIVSSRMSEVWTGLFGDITSTVTTAWQGIVAAISSGDFQTAGQIAFTALEIGWLTFTGKIQEVWKRVSGFFVNTWLNAVQSLVEIGASIYFGIAKYFDKLSTALVNGFDTAAIYIAGAIDGIQTAIAKAIIKAQEFFGLFSKDQSVQIQQTLDEDLARRASKREQGLGQRFGQRAEGLNQRDQQRRQTADQFSQIVAEDINRRRPSQRIDNGLSDAQQRLADLQVQLQAKSSEAVAKVAQAQGQSQAAQRADQSQRAAASAISSTSAGSVGTFVSGVASRIAGGGVQDEIKDATLETAANTWSRFSEL